MPKEKKSKKKKPPLSAAAQYEINRTIAELIGCDDAVRVVPDFKVRRIAQRSPRVVVAAQVIVDTAMLSGKTRKELKKYL